MVRKGAAYVGLIASRQYVTEMQFAVRGITQPLMGAGAGTFGGGQLAALMRLNNSQEANIVASYITSDNIVRDVDDDIDLRAKFSSTKIDFWDRLERNASFEQLVDYWKDKVYVGIDAVSGIMTVKVTAFSPADSLDIARAILKRSGKLVEVMLTQARQSALSRAEDEVRVATERSNDARSKLREFRNSEKLLDTKETARSLTELLTKLRQSRIAAEVEAQIEGLRLSNASPALQESRARLVAIDNQIKSVEAQLTQANGGNAPTVSKAMETYEALSLDSKMADDYLMHAERILANARNDILTNHVYLEAFQPPSLPEKYSYPRPLLDILATAIGAFLLWSIASLILVHFEDHID